MPEIITGGDAADIIGVSRETISRWVEEGKLIPFQRLTNRIMLFDRAVIEEFASQYIDGRKKQNQAVA